MTVPKFKYKIRERKIKNLDPENLSCTHSQAKTKIVKRIPLMKKCRRVIGNLKARILGFTALIFLFSYSTVMVETAPVIEHGFHRVMADEEIPMDKVMFTGDISERVKRNYGLFCFQFFHTKCNQFYSQLLAIGDEAKQINNAPLKRLQFQEITTGSRAKLNSMISQIQEWQRNRKSDLELCFQCERYARRYKSRTPSGIRPSFFDIPIPIPENYIPRTAEFHEQ